MAKSNGNGSNGNGAHPGSSVVDLAAAVAGKRAAIASLEEAAAALVAERAETETRLSGLRAAVHVAGDKGKADDLKGANARLQVIADSLDGHAFQVATYRAELAGLEAELESVERLDRLTRAETEAAEFGRQQEQLLRRAKVLEAEKESVRQELYAIQQEKLARHKTIHQCLNQMGGEGTDGHPWPPRETMATIDAQLEQLTAGLPA